MKNWPMSVRSSQFTASTRHLAEARRLKEGDAQRHFAILLAFAGVATYLLISDNLLVTLGIPYDIPGGTFFAKVHPGSYLVTSAAMVLLFSDHNNFNPLLFYVRFVHRARPLFLFQITILVMLIYSIIQYGPSGSAFLIESFLMPMVLAFVFEHARPEELKRLFHLLLLLLLLNALLGLLEYLTQSRLVPYMAGDQEILETYFRATALGGHPLSNSHRTALFLASLLVWAYRGKLFWGLVSVFMLSLFAFGSRTSLALALALYVGWGAHKAFKNFFSGRMEYRGILLTLVAVVLIPGALVGMVVFLGLGERIFATFYWDTSAQSRLMAFLVFQFLSFQDLIVGISPERIDMILTSLKMSTTLTDIENFWILMILQFGLGVFSFFFFTFLGAIKFVARGGRLPLWAPTVLFLIMISSNNSLAVKSQEFVLFVANLYGVRGVLQRKDGVRPEDDQTVAPESRRQIAVYSRLPKWTINGSGSSARQ